GTRGLAAFTHDMAKHVASVAVNMLANYSPTFNTIELAVMRTPDPSAIPDLETLFGSLDLCECADCRSVHSPAAHLAELLAFLEERPQKGGATSVRDILFERRPDLGDIELTCENTNVPLPYVDLVNELLENAVAPFTPFTLAAALQTDLDNATLS